mgnify:FL=1|tara:strand:+ start:4009 stop:4215 length:207 start_codon:yes stop_codon:yes gene_type:complete
MKLKGIAFDDTKWNVDEARREMKKLGIYGMKKHNRAIRENNKLYYKFVEDYEFNGYSEEILNDYIFFY